MKRLPKNEVVSGVMDFLQTLEDESVVSEVAHKLNQEDKTKAKSNTAIITSAASIDEEDKKKIEKKLNSEFNRNLEFSYKEDKSILGGFIVRVGDFVYDNSIKGQLENFKQTLYGEV